MRLQFLAISDTHLGEETSLLCFPHGRQHLWRTLRDKFGDGTDAPVPVEELVLVGDIPDRTLSSTSQIITQTNALMATLGSALAVKRAVYVPGNHDHTLWTDYAEARHGAKTASTPPGGELIIEKGGVAHAAAAELLSIFFGHPEGSGWRAIQRERAFDMAIANPIYARAFGGRTYVFAHGTHFRPDVSAPAWIKKVVDHLQGDEIIGHVEIDSSCDVKKARSLVELEDIVTPFVDSLWPSSRGNATSHSDQLWYLLTYISGKFGHKRPAPADSARFSWDELNALAAEGRIKRLTPEHDPGGALLAPDASFGNRSIDLCNRHFLGKALAYVEASGIPRWPATFVYGDTHEGGWGRLPDPQGGEVRVYNTGAWVVHNEHDHPPCHVFAVDEHGGEHMLDVSFSGVSVDGEPLLALASEDAENKKRTSSKLLRFALSLLPTPR